MNPASIVSDILFSFLTNYRNDAFLTLLSFHIDYKLFDNFCQTKFNPQFKPILKLK